MASAAFKVAYGYNPIAEDNPSFQLPRYGKVPRNAVGHGATKIFRGQNPHMLPTGAPWWLSLAAAATASTAR